MLAVKLAGDRMKILGTCLGKDVHNRGLLKFLQIAEGTGYETSYLGTARSVSEIITGIEEENPDIVAVSYRLSPESAEGLLLELKRYAEAAGVRNRKYLFGGTPSNAEVARKMGFFDKIYVGGESPAEIKNYLSGKEMETIKEYPDNLLDRIQWKKPILRHHFGLPSLEETIDGIRKIAEAEALDVISLGPDQDAQEYFFHPELQTAKIKGDGGVPIRKPEDLERIFEASRRGNYPLLRCYSGTNDLIRMAEMYVETIKNAWCAVPLMWYNVLDGRSKRSLRDSISENQELMKWHAERGIPVEVNESHHWSLRRAPDTIAVAMAYIAAYNAKQMGVGSYISQYMFNTPRETSPKMDLAKMLAKIELIESLHDEDFQSYRQVRSGLDSFPPNLDMAKGQLISSLYMAMSLEPHIAHIVGYCEGHHVARATDVIESSLMVQQMIKNYKMGLPDMTLDPEVAARKEQLMEESMILIEAIESLGDVEDPLTDPEVLSRAVEIGLLDAPDLMGNGYAQGEILTDMLNGVCYAIDPQTGRPMSEKDRISRII
jgi:methylmalonyl-CoA mutase cobalamin-binding subunit